MTNQLNDVITMINSKMNFFMIKECLASIGFECKSVSMPGLKDEVECLLAHQQLSDEAESINLI